MTSKLTQDQIKDILFTALETLFEIDPKEIKLDTDLHDLDIDSIDAIDLLDHIKRETGYKLSADDFRNVRKVQDVVDAIMKIQDAAE